jgi:hypothetical protein
VAAAAVAAGIAGGNDSPAAPTATSTQ